MKPRKTDQRRREAMIVFVVSSLLVSLVIGAAILIPELFASISAFFDLYDLRNRGLLDWARAFNLIMIVMAAYNLIRVIVRFPRRRRFYLMLWPLLAGAFYFFTQFIEEGAIYPYNGLIVINIITAFSMAGYSVSLGLVQNMASLEPQVKPERTRS